MNQSPTRAILKNTPSNVSIVAQRFFTTLALSTDPKDAVVKLLELFETDTITAPPDNIYKINPDLRNDAINQVCETIIDAFFKETFSHFEQTERGVRNAGAILIGIAIEHITSATAAVMGDMYGFRIPHTTHLFWVSKRTAVNLANLPRNDAFITTASL